MISRRSQPGCSTGFRLFYFCLVLKSIQESHAFTPNINKSFSSPSLSCLDRISTRTSCASLLSTKPRQNTNNSKNDKSTTPREKKKQFTLKDLRQEIQQKPADFLSDNNNNKQGKKRYRRSRKRTENPQQQYVYARQRPKQISTDTSNNATVVTPSSMSTISPALQLARDCGLVNPAAQHCDPLVDTIEPEILGQIRVGDEEKSGSYAYIVHKPAGWAILGGTASGSGNAAAADKAAKSPEEKSAYQDDDQLQPSSSSQPFASSVGKKKKSQQVTRLEITDTDGSFDVLEFSEDDLLAVMTPDEIADYKAELEALGEEQITKKVRTRKVKVRVDEDNEDDDEDDLEFLDDELLQMDEAELIAELTPEELAEYEAEFGPIPDELRPSQHSPGKKLEEIMDTMTGYNGVVPNSKGSPQDDKLLNETSLDPKSAQIYSKIEARKSTSNKASFQPTARPSVVGWLKDLKAQEGNPMRGGKYWTALAGATAVDDSGIVIVCPKQYTDNVFVDYLEYTAVVGNVGQVAPKQKGVDSLVKGQDDFSMETVSTLRRNRGNDIIQTVKVMVPEKCSSCSGIVGACQDQFLDGIRGDPAGNPLSRLAHRRLLHCNAVSVSSLVHDESVEIETDGIPDDMAIWSERRNQHEYQQGSFLGRASLKANPLTTAYREINGAADGFPGWTVDRYDKWLLVQHDPSHPRGPLPSIHDGNTAGVYYLAANPDRSAMGSSTGTNSRPHLLEGQPAPDFIDVLENGVTYQVSLDKDLSTGLFLDQRPQRAWLTRNCNANTHILNCFAHCGGFSIAAARAGASTTSVDLNKKWLDRVEPQLKANGVEFDIRHDCIYGDCFEWLAKLAKRGEKYDIVILDPPSTSLGKKKKRWSIKNDMPELVSLAAQVVKKGGLLWTTTNSASVIPVKFARLCKRGLEDAGYGAAKLERIQSMPHDFPSIGPQPVKNYIWRLP